MTTLQLFTETWSQAVFAQGFVDLLKLVDLVFICKTPACFQTPQVLQGIGMNGSSVV